MSGVVAGTAWAGLPQVLLPAGTSQATVVEAAGWPKGKSQVDNREVWTYPTFTAVFIDGKLEYAVPIELPGKKRPVIEAPVESQTQTQAQGQTDATKATVGATPANQPANAPAPKNDAESDTMGDAAVTPVKRGNPLWGTVLLVASYVAAGAGIFLVILHWRETRADDQTRRRPVSPKR